jgi:redox-sensitive bicupin YhaK (pirin superfamily)
MTQDAKLVIEPKIHDLGGFQVRRILPSARRRMVGGIDVRPHPHIGLATVTYLFEGEIWHRDSLGYVQPIRPGDVNWMTAGAGIVHSERSGPEERARDSRLHGIQSWVALPRSAEETAPGFHHHPAASLPLIEKDGASMRLIAGTAYGARSPVETFSDMFYLEAEFSAGGRLALPDEYEERAVYVVAGEVTIGAERHGPERMIVLPPGSEVSVRAEKDARVMLLGGAALDGARHIWWNFVASSPERIEKAKADWKAGAFAKVPEETEFIPLPE